jgi:hypothetical protein
MPVDRPWSRGSRKLAGVLLAVTVPPLVILVWLGLVLAGQDRERLERSLLEERRLALRTVAQALDRSLTEIERHLSDGPVPPGLVRLTLSAGGVTADPGDRALWLPARELAVDRAPAFAAAEVAEYNGNTATALAAYRELLSAPDDTLRAGALVRIARVHRKAGRWDDALEHYGTLATMAHVRIAGAPADLQARRQICAVLEQAGRRDDVAREAAALRDDFDRGRWSLDRPAWELAAADIGRWTGTPVPVDGSRLLVSNAAGRLWPTELHAATASTRRIALVVDNLPVTVLTRAQGADVVALVVPPQVLETTLAQAASATTLATGSVALMNDEGRVLGGGVTGDAHDILKLSSSETGLPWTVALGPEEPSVISARLASRQWLIRAHRAAAAGRAAVSRFSCTRTSVCDELLLTT